MQVAGSVLLSNMRYAILMLFLLLLMDLLGFGMTIDICLVLLMSYFLPL